MPFTPPQDQIDAELARVLRSQSFGRAARQRTLLAYLVNASRGGDTSRLKESTIALDVFGRDASTYDSASDGIVRVSVNRLRELLDRYYDSEGARAPLRFEIQRGGYVPILRRATPAGLPPSPRIAVLPLANFTGSPDKESLCDGLTEDIIDALTRVPDARIIARTSSFRFKGQTLDTREIARMLEVDALLEGSVQQVGDRLRVTAQLILGSDGTHLWSHVFLCVPEERESLQLAIVDIMLRALGKRPQAEANDDAARRSREIPVAAQRLIDQARGLNVTQVPDNLVYAEALALRATELAPDQADAWFVLAMVRYSRRSTFLAGDAGRRVIPAREALDRALALDPHYAQAISLSAYLLITDELRWQEALQRARHAVKLAPNHGGVNARLAFIEMCFGRFDAAAATYAHVFSLDPLAPPARYHYALALAYAGRVGEAIHTVEAGAQQLGESIMQHDTMCSILDLGDDVAAAHDYAESALSKYPASVNIAMHAAYCRARAGDLAGSRALRSEIDRVTGATQHYLAMYAESGGPDIDAFFDHASALVAEREPHIMTLPMHPLFQRYRDDPRWQPLLDRIGFPASAAGLEAAN
jgi:serine/threonine-protein kinase